MNGQALRRRLTIPRPTAWRCFVLLLMLALGSEYWNKDPLSIAGVDVPWPFFVPVLSLLPLLVPVSQRRWTQVLRPPKALGPMLLFWICCGLSVAGVAVSPASEVVQFLKTFTHLTIYIVFVWAMVRWITWPRLRLLVSAYYALGLAAGVLSVLQMLHGGLDLFPWLAFLRFQSADYDVGAGLNLGFRASSFFGEPSWAARYYVHFIALALAFWAQTRQRRHLAALVLFLVAFYGANSLLGYVILSTFLLTMAAAQMWRRNMFTLSRRYKLALGLAAYFAVVAGLVGVRAEWPDLLDRSISRIGLVMQGGGSAGNRIDSVYAGLEVWKRAPLLGVGLGNIGPYIMPFYQDPAWVLRSQMTSDSLYVQLLAETGLPGFFAFLWFWALLLWFPAPAARVLAAHPEAAHAHGWMRFLQIDLFAQAVGMINAADYLNPHLWTVVGIVLACKVVVIRATRPVPPALDSEGLPGVSAVPGAA